MDKQSIAARVKALLAKTTENGCTEAEAMSAAAKARELMDRYHIDHGEVGMEEEGVYGAICRRNNYKTLLIKDRLSWEIAAFCDVKVWLHKQQGTITYFGLRPDADFAVWLTDSLDQFVHASVLAFMVTQPKLDARPRWEREKAFVLGAISQINARLHYLTAERKRAMSGGTGRSLVVMKSAIVAREFAKLGMKLRAGTGLGTSARDGGAFSAGRAAGDRASLGRPLNGGGSMRLIGGR
jgi:hypothetical protein